ncbi:hypothetical protein ACPPVS_08220 [Cellulomonas sp. McL0617]|uniref:hypothetical protein n=1 Tax=Cellulomonas sp. McL0617 TaxID=3415675 RepID=UPI003CEBE7EC
MPPAPADPEVQVAAEVPSTPMPDDRVLRATRVVSIVIVPFLLLAWAVLYPWPSDTGRLFAWTIKAHLSAMVLGSAYLGGAYFFVRAAGASGWHTIKAGFPPVGLFATLMGVATLLHWETFVHGHVAFWLWVLLYFTTPFLIAWVWWRNRVHDAPAAADDLRLPGAAAAVIAGVGGLALVTGLFLFVAPATAVSIWPWPLTPLTARVMGAVFCLGSAGLGAIREQRWSSARIPVQVALVMLVLLVVAGVRGRSSLDPARPLTWLFVVGFVGLTLSTAALYVRMERRSP